MPQSLVRLFTGLIVLFTALQATASPTELEQWQDWVLERHQEHTCPWVLDNNPARVCIWPAHLALELRSQGLDFSYRVEVFQDQALVPLPGSTEAWPLRVTANAKPAAVLDRGGAPHVLLDAGVHELQGQFQWQRRPSSLAVPESIALVSMTENGRATSLERRSGQIVLGSDSTRSDPVKQSNSLSIEVFRKLSDGVPMTMETRLILTVSGEPREVQVGQLVWPSMELMALQSPLPARVEDNGDLRVQLTAGRHTLVFHTRFSAAVEQLSMNRVQEAWPQHEYLSFASDSDLRQLKLSGAPGIDTSQVPVPNEWKDLPTWRLDAKTSLQLVTEYRGEQSPAANDIAVNRKLWLDFDGRALTGLELLSGSMRRDWRLDAWPDTQLGSAQVSGRPVLVTRHKQAQGVEIRSPNINLQAVTRIDNPQRFSVSGWDSRVDRFSATLHIPPGWRVLHASGVDGIEGSWISEWDLWDIFLLLIIVAATRKLLGVKVAVLALLALLLGRHEAGMPSYLLALLLLLLPLSAVAGGRIRRGVTVAVVLTCAALLLSLLAFAISNFRLAIYPSLEQRAVDVYQTGPNNELVLPSPVGAAADMMESQSITGQVMAQKGKRAAVQAAPQVQRDAYQLGDNDRVQTGPGVPKWHWNTLHLSASSPVPEGAELSFIYSPPWLTRLWRILNVLLTLAYAGLLASAVLGNLRRSPSDPAAKEQGGLSSASASASSPVALLLTCGLLLGASPNFSQAQDFPPDYLLTELEARLLQPPLCSPHCISLDQGLITTTEETMTISFKAYAAADVLLRLPTPRQGWRVSEIQLDGQRDVAARLHQGELSILLTKGHHTITIVGALQGEIASVNLPLPIHNIEARGQHWQLSGLVDGRVPSGTLSLRAMSAVRQEASTVLSPDPVKPFFRVHREFDIGLQWRLVTRVTRLAPSTGPVAVEVPLLEFERLLSEHIGVKDRRALLQFSERQREISWESSIKPQDSLELVAAAGSHYVETWRLRPAALWRVDYEGIAATRGAAGAGSLQPEWKPWPGESLKLSFYRPEGIAGPTYTVEEASLDYQPGGAIRKSLLTLKIKASIGQDYVFELPADARVTSLKRDASVLNLPDSHRVSVALQPGEQQIVLSFEQDGAAGWLSSTPSLTLPSGASNITLSYNLPRDRWPLYLSGPDIGPAIMYWGVFCVIMLAAIVLSMLDRRLRTELPVSLLGWLLLGIGLSTVNGYGVLVLAVFFFALGFRQRVEPELMDHLKFNFMQVILALVALLSLLTLISAIPLGLLSSPQMLITGNDSWSHLYYFFQDRAPADSFPTATVVSLDIMVYRVAMLIWSLWLASRLLAWVAWGWKAFGRNGLWLAK
ncbi:hypothetical protein H2508_00540 [Parahaliea sp. F7430]|uniref:Uncharacterized protein n=1 Tax=Sediminihaliea albiluteola TaxID=2758564 RepID=A0A7W2YHN3_9GAMM|nr:hypothetical protein [Sediminihaliea albiluteola]MBA6411606.1 hypothetical protein [Sediminihaliea albiluteola]